MDKDRSKDKYKFIIVWLASLICIPDTLKGGIFPNTTSDNLKSEEKNGQNGKDRM